MCLQDASPINSTIPSLDGAYEHRPSDAHTEVSDGPPDPPSNNGAGIYELLNSSLPTVKEEEFTGSNSGTASLRASYSQLQMGASSTQMAGAVAPAGLQEQALTETAVEGDANQLSPQAPVESKFSAFGGSYMTVSPVQSVTLAQAPSAAVCRETTSGPLGSQPESAGQGILPVTSMAGPPSGIVLGGISSMGPVSSMLSGPVSATTAGPVSSTTAGVILDDLAPLDTCPLFMLLQSCIFSMLFQAGYCEVAMQEALLAAQSLSTLMWMMRTTSQRAAWLRGHSLSKVMHLLICQSSLAPHPLGRTRSASHPRVWLQAVRIPCCSPAVFSP